MVAANNVPDLTAALKGPKRSRATRLCEIVRSWENEMRAFHPLWETCFRFREGEQWGYFNTTSWEWRGSVPARKHIASTRITLNHIIRITAQLRSLLTREIPKMVGLAVGAQGADVAAGKVLDALTRYLWRHYGLEDMYGDCIENSATCGTWGIEVEWDANAGRMVDSEDPDEEAYFAQAEEEGPEFGMTDEDMPYLQVPEGRLIFKLRSPFEIIPAPHATADNDGEGMFLQSNESLSSLRAAFGAQKVKDVDSGEAFDDSGAEYVQRIQRAGTGLAAREGNVTPRELVRVYKLYARSSPDFPRGRHVIFTEEKVLYEGDNPIYPTEEEEFELWPDTPWPVFIFRHYRRPKSWHGHGVVQDLLEPQKALNGMASKELKIIKDHANKKLMVPIGHKGDIDNDSSTFMEYSPRHGRDAFGYLDRGSHPFELGAFQSNMRDHMDTIAGINEATQGQANAEDSGRKVQLLQQQDLGKLSPIKRRHDRQMARVVLYAARLFRRHAQSGMMAVITDESAEVEVRQFETAALVGGLDLVVVNDTSLPDDPTARHLAISNMVQTTMGMEPTEKQAIWELYGMRDFRKFEGAQHSDRDCQRVENLKLHEGEEPFVEFWHDDPQHIAELRIEMNTTTWIAKCQQAAEEEEIEDYRQSSVYQRFVRHLQAHMDEMARKQGGMPQQQPGGAPSPASGGAPPGPSGPMSTSAPQTSVARPQAGAA